MRIWHISAEKKTETGHQTKKAWIVRSRHHQSFTTKKAVGREEVYACILQKRFEKRNTPSTAGQAVWTAENFFHLSLECVSKNLGDTPRSQNLLHQAARRQPRFRQRLDLFHGSGCITMKVCLDAIGQCRARLGQRSTCFSRMMSPTLDHCSRLCNSSRIRSANCCISKDPSIWTFKSAVATRTAGRSGVQTPWSSSNPETSICSPEWMEALSATATSQDRLLLTHFQHTRWSLSQMEHSPVGACDEVSQASQKALLHIPQRSQGAGLISEFSSKTGLVWTANAARAPMSTSLRVLGSCKILTGCLEIQPWANRCIAPRSTGAKAIACWW